MPKESFAERFEKEYGTETSCPKNNGKKHKPDWKATTVVSDGATFYLDVVCKRCGRSGCIGTVKKLEDSIDW